MNIKGQIAADWARLESQHPFPRSWYRVEDRENLHLVLADSYAAGCISTYVQLPPDEHLDNERVQYLVGCRDVFMKAQPLITDEEGKWRLDLFLRMSTMVLVDCGVLDADELANLSPTP